MRIYWVNIEAKGRLALAARPRGGDWLESDLRSVKAAGVHVVLSLLTGEEATELGLLDEPGLCAEFGIRFLKHPIPDRQPPPDARAFAQCVATLAQTIEAGENALVHCRAGLGRAALTAAAVLVRISRLSPTRAFQQVGVARGMSVPDTPAQAAWLEQNAALVTSTAP